MESRFGRGFITNIMLVSKHIGLPPERAWSGLSDHLVEIQIPDQFRGTEVEELLTMLRQKANWHQNGIMDDEDLDSLEKTLKKLVIAIDRELGIADPAIGKFD
ncbi:MAG: hypothetical protein JW931_00640 [Methanomicrobiaceae archaeon]|nr:hypothetical protein [Methanomicrobiaceae archaeon]